MIRRTGEMYDFFEYQCSDRPMILLECEQERNQLAHIYGVKVANTGFVRVPDFDPAYRDGFILIDGKDLYR